jgi:GT2 family glycosyltransferase
MRTSIIIPTFNRLVFTRICTSLLRSMFVDDPDVEIIVVDNGSSDGTPAFLGALEQPFRPILCSTNQGFASACNRGADAARGDTLVFLNNDTVPLPNWLFPLEDVLRDDRVGIAGSMLLFPDDTIQHAGIVISELRIPVHMYYMFPRTYPSANKQMDYQAVTGACLAVRKSTFDRLGGFDAGYRNSFEDVDLCLHARASGLRVVYCPSSMLYHFESASEGRHSHDDLNQKRFLARWQDYVVVDEPERYRADGFAAVPRIPARLMSQVLAQATFERRRANTAGDTLKSLNVALSSQSETSEFPSGTSFGSSLRVLFDFPCVVAAGSDVAGTLHLHNPQDWSPTQHTSLRYEWIVPPLTAAVLSGAVLQPLPGPEAASAVNVRVLVPAASGEYLLQWVVVDGMKRQVIGTSSVTVAPRYAFECRAFLPDKFVCADSCRITVRLRNTGTETWLPHGGFRLSYHWLDESGEHAVHWEGIRTPILDRIAHGDETVLEVAVATPARPGKYRLVWDPIHEGEFWFSNIGATAPSTVVVVEPSDRLSTLEHVKAADEANLDDFIRQLRRKEWMIQVLASAVDSSDRTRLEQVRQKDAEITALQHEIVGLQDSVSVLRQGLERRDGELQVLENHLKAIQRGRVMIALSIVQTWRRRILQNLPGPTL